MGYYYGLLPDLDHVVFRRKFSNELLGLRFNYLPFWRKSNVIANM